MQRPAKFAAALGAFLFAAPALAASIAPLYQFPGGAAGSGPTATPVRDSAGNLYGETGNGGTGCTANPTYGCGVVYKLSPSGQETILLSLQGANGAGGEGPLTLIGNTLFGTAASGGAHNYGLVFSLNTDGTGFTILHQFSGPEGAGPVGPLLQGPSGVLYGIALGGDKSSDGVLYKVTTGGLYTVLHKFTGGADGGSPNSIVLTAGGIIVGGDGSPNVPCQAPRCGVVYAYNPATEGFRVLATFAQFDGASPMVGGITADNVVYGAANGGGANLEGTLFELVPDGKRFQIDLLYTFSNTSGGQRPGGGPTLSSSGALIGSTFGTAGTAYGGTLYSFANGALTTLYKFTTTDSTGWEPRGTPAITASGAIIGVTLYGGDTTCAAEPSPFNCGAIYTYTP